MFIDTEQASQSRHLLHDYRSRIAEVDPQRTSRQHASGRLTARERLAILLDEGTFHEIGMFRRHEAHGFGIENDRPCTDGVITGWGLVGGHRIMVCAADFRILGGSLGSAHAEKIHRAMDLALEARIPFVNINDGAGARIQEGARALAGYGGIFRRHVAMSGVVPQISVIVGPCAGGAAYSPALTDFTFMVEEISQLFLTGPAVVKAVTGEDLSAQELGGAAVHTRSGVASFRYPNETDCLHDVRYLLGILPPNGTTPAPSWPSSDPATRLCHELDALIPMDDRLPYDVRELIEAIADEGELFEVQPDWAPNLVIGFGHIDGALTGFVANQPSVLAGVLDIESSDKGARFVQFCDAFSIPIVTLVDVPGFLPGSDQESRGVIRHGAKLLYAYCNATVPRIQVITRKAYGGAYIVMDSRSIGSDLSLAWPSNQVAVMGAEGAAEIVFRKEITAAADPLAERQARISSYRDQLMSPFYAPERGLVDEVIAPAETRRALAGALALLRDKRSAPSQRKHGNPPQ